MGRANKTPRTAAGKDMPASTNDLQAAIDACEGNIAMLDNDGVVRLVNEAWRAFGRRNGYKGETVGLNYLTICDEATGPWSEQGPLTAAAIRAVLAGRLKEYNLEYPCHSPRVQRWFRLQVRPFVGSRPLRVLVAHVDIGARVLAERAAQDAARRLTTVREEERRHVAGELHDNIGQRLLGMSLMLQNTLATHGAKHPAVGRVLARSVKACRDAISDVRTLSELLYPPTLQLLGLGDSLRDLEQMSGQTRIRVACRLDEAQLAPDHKIGLFRVAQEAVANAVRHGGGKRIDVRLRQVHGEVILTVRDNGVGFDPQKVGGRGVGLTSMDERARAMGGRLTIRSRPGATVVEVRAPMRPE